MEVSIEYEQRRECGFRSPAVNGLGIYLIGSAATEPCERLPFPLEACPCCGSGIKPARGFTWLDPITLLAPYAHPPCTDHVGISVHGLEHDHAACAMCNPAGVAGPQGGLIWVGNKFYKTGRQFLAEAAQMGISRKLAALPNDFVVGKTVVYLAHRKVYVRRNEMGAQEWGQGIFTAFVPTRVDIVIDDPDNVPVRAVELAKRLGEYGRLVKVIPIGGENEGDEYEDF